MQSRNEKLNDYDIYSMKFQAARKASAILNIQGPLGKPEDEFRPKIESESLGLTYHILYLQIYGALLLNLLHPTHLNVRYHSSLQLNGGQTGKK